MQEGNILLIKGHLEELAVDIFHLELAHHNVYLTGYAVVSFFLKKITF